MHGARLNQKEGAAGTLRSVEVLSDQAIRVALEELPGWTHLSGGSGRSGELVKEFRFPSFLDAIAFIDRLAEAAEAANHHPDLENHYDRVRVALHTWSENGVTRKDVDLAHRIEAVVAPPAGE